jgi:hypothetical protein
MNNDRPAGLPKIVPSESFRDRMSENDSELEQQPSILSMKLWPLALRFGPKLKWPLASVTAVLVVSASFLFPVVISSGQAIKYWHGFAFAAAAAALILLYSKIRTEAPISELPGILAHNLPVILAHIGGVAIIEGLSAGAFLGCFYLLHFVLPDQAIQVVLYISIIFMTPLLLSFPSALMDELLTGASSKERNQSVYEEWKLSLLPSLMIVPCVLVLYIYAQR